MRSKTLLAIAAGCAGALVLSVTAVARPAAQQDAKRVQHRAQQAKPAVVTPAPKAAPVQARQAATVSSFKDFMASIEPASFSARMMSSTALVSEARKYMGTNPTRRSRLWCATFMNFVLAKVGYSGTNSDAAKSFTGYGRRISRPQVGAIAVLTRGKNGGHVGVVSGVDPHGNPIIISGNHNKRVGEAVYSRSRVIAYVMPTDDRPVTTQVAARGPVSRPAPDSGIVSPITELMAAIEAEQSRAQASAQVQAPRQVQPAPPVQTAQAAPPQARAQIRAQARAPLPQPSRMVQQTPQQGQAPYATRGGSDPFSELASHLDRRNGQRMAMPR